MEYWYTQHLWPPIKDLARSKGNETIYCSAIYYRARLFIEGDKGPRHRRVMTFLKKLEKMRFQPQC